MLAFFWKSLLNNERWKVLEALRNTFVKSPQTHENRDERRPIITGSRCVTLFLELLTILLFKFFSTKVAMVVSSDRQSKRGDKIPHKKFQVPFKPGFIEETLIRPALEGNKHMIGWNAYKLHLTMCESLLNSTELLQELKDFDLIVYDSFGPCAVLLSDLLRLPKVAISITPPNNPFSIFHMVPMPLSYVPIHQSGYSSNMTFIQRAVNVVSYCLMQALFEILYVRSYDALMAKFNISAERSFRESFGNAELVIFLADFAMEYPQALLPGGFNAPQRRTQLIKCVCTLRADALLSS